MKATCTFLVVLLLSFSQVLSGPLQKCSRPYQLNPAVTRFRKYLQIDTSREENIYKAVEFWKQQAVELGLPFHVFSPGGKPVCVITLFGSDPSLPSIMLNSHMDVVPAVEDEWIYPPYSAYMDENGDIYARGSQDAKDVSCQYMEAIRRLKRDNVTLLRNVHVTLMPDEETGGFNGIKPFVKTEALKIMNVGFILDEGLTSPDNTLLATYQDRRPWQLKVTFHGEGGHGSGMPDNTAIEKVTRFMNMVTDYRDRMKHIMKSLNRRDFGSYTSVNVNVVAGGHKPNVIPTEFGLIVDMRLSTESNVTEVEHLVQQWIAETGNGTEFTFIRRDDVSEKTILNNSNPYWVAMKNAVNEMNLEIVPVVCPATSDSLVLRNLGYLAVGFSPKLQTQSRAHSKDEYLNIDTFLQGIEIYYEIIKKLGNVQPFTT